MNIVVCVKQVPETAVERTLKPGAGTLDRDTPDGLINELDEYAIEEGLKIVWCSPDANAAEPLLRADRHLHDEVHIPEPAGWWTRRRSTTPDSPPRRESRLRPARGPAERYVERMLSQAT